VHLFTLAMMVFVLQLIVNTITINISVVFFQFLSNSKGIQEVGTLKQVEVTH